MTDGEPDALDQLSIRQTNESFSLSEQDVSRDDFLFWRSQVEQAAGAVFEHCANGAPHIFFIDATDRARLVQGCCNDWTCPRCGQLRALHEYGRMVNGATALAGVGESLYFLTLTCRGKDLVMDTVDDCYQIWCNRLLTNARAMVKRAGLTWAYAQVTERQRRGAPHSHLLTTFCPSDVTEYATGSPLPNGTVARHDTLYSSWLERACVSAGLGRMTDLSIVNSATAAAVYIAKYLFKQTAADVWPKHWRRVRYSRSWPKLPEHHTDGAFALVRLADWRRLDTLDRTVYADSAATAEMAWARLVTSVVYRPTPASAGLVYA